MKKSLLIGYLAGLAVGAILAYKVLVYASSSPQFSLADFSFMDLNGNAISLEEVRGKAVVINIWATWCPPCIAEMPGIAAAYQKFKNDSVVFLVASDESREKIIRFKEKRGLDLPLCSFMMTGSSLPMSGARPQTYVFNRKGELIYNRMGAFKWDDPAVLNRLQSWFK